MNNKDLKQHELFDTTEESEICSFCGNSVPEGDFVCAECNVRTENE